MTTPPPSGAALDVAAVAAEARALLDAATPGPWCNVGYFGNDDDGPHIEGPDEGTVAIVTNRVDDNDREGRANAALIAAAPTMLRHVVALAVRVTAAEAAHAALAGAVREERALAAEYDAAWAAHIAGGAPLDAAEGVLAMCDRLDGVRAATDALLRGAPGGFVRASVVVEYVRAVEAHRLAGVMPSGDHPARARLRDAHRAVVDALAAVKETP